MYACCLCGERDIVDETMDPNMQHTRQHITHHTSHHNTQTHDTRTSQRATASTSALTCQTRVRVDPETYMHMESMNDEL